MRRVPFSPPAGDPSWDAWQVRVRKRRDEIVKVYLALNEVGVGHTFSPKIHEATYRGSREFILKAFKKKCAYCESLIAPTLGTGDVEHYRPKKAVKEYRYEPPPDAGEDTLGEVLAPFRDQPGNSGYFWLAYNIGNLLPSCRACNENEKRSFFPVKRGRLQCDELPDPKVEEPMLVNPYLDDPNLHLAFTDPNGFVRPLSLKGAISIDVYGLNRESLPEARARAISTAGLEFKAWYDALYDDDQVALAAREAVLNRYETGEEPYSAAALTHVGERQEQLLKRGLAMKTRRGIWPSTLKSTIVIT